MFPKRSIQIISKTAVGWDVVARKFIVYYCMKHNFYPDQATIESKCFQRKCHHLCPQRKKEIVVKNLREALAIKKAVDNAQIEQRAEGYYITIVR